MSEDKECKDKILYHFVYDAVIDPTGTERLSIQWNGFINETEEELKEKLDLVARLMDHRVKAHNERALAVAEKIRISQKEKLEKLPEQFN